MANWAAIADRTHCTDEPVAATISRRANGPIWPGGYYLTPKPFLASRAAKSIWTMARFSVAMSIPLPWV